MELTRLLWGIDGAFSPESSFSVKHTLTSWPKIPTPGRLPQWEENLRSHRNLNTTDYSGPLGTEWLQCGDDLLSEQGSAISASFQDPEIPSHTKTETAHKPSYCSELEAGGQMKANSLKDCTLYIPTDRTFLKEKDPMVTGQHRDLGSYVCTWGGMTFKGVFAGRAPDRTVLCLFWCVESLYKVIHTLKLSCGHKGQFHGM